MDSIARLLLSIAITSTLLVLISLIPFYNVWSSPFYLQLASFSIIIFLVYSFLQKWYNQN